METSSTPVVTYKPSTFYFRRALRSAEAAPAIVKIVRSLHAEIELCNDYARNHGVMDRHDSDGGLFEVPLEVYELRAYGLALCCRLEEVKQSIRDQGLIPPKRHIMTSEAEDKGWPTSA